VASHWRCSSSRSPPSSAAWPASASRATPSPPARVRVSRLAYARRPTDHTRAHTQTQLLANAITLTPLPLLCCCVGGHLWCARCAIAALSNNKQQQCPRCDGPCLGEPTASLAVRLVIAVMGARCPWRCGWAGPLGALDAHWAQCGHEAVACAVAGCGAAVARCDLAAHMGGSAGTVARHLGGLAAVCFAKASGYSASQRRDGGIELKMLTGWRGRTCAGTGSVGRPRGATRIRG